MQTLLYGRRLLIGALLVVAMIGLIGTWLMQTTPASAAAVLVPQPTHPTATPVSKAQSTPVSRPTSAARATPMPTTDPATPMRNQGISPAQAHLCATRQNSATCFNTDPVAEHCSQDVQTIISKSVSLKDTGTGRVDLRYSASCHSAWLRAVIPVGSQIAKVQTTLVLSADTIDQQTETVPQDLLADRSLQAYTNMTWQPQMTPAMAKTILGFAVFTLGDGTSLSVFV